MMDDAKKCLTQSHEKLTRKRHDAKGMMQTT
jgi:hypothetical protein